MFVCACVSVAARPNGVPSRHSLRNGRQRGASQPKTPTPSHASALPPTPAYSTFFPRIATGDVSVAGAGEARKRDEARGKEEEKEREKGFTEEMGSPELSLGNNVED